MSAGFDPYLEWFGISADQSPPTHYQLLNLPLFESDRQQINGQAELVLGFLHEQLATENAGEAKALIAHIQAVRGDLLDPARKSAYDEWLRSTLPDSAAHVEHFTTPAVETTPPDSQVGARSPNEPNPYAAPPAPIEPAPRMIYKRIQLSSRWYRLGGAIVDGLVFSIFVGFAWYYVMKVHQPANLAEFQVHWWPAYAVAISPWVLINAVMLTTMGQSIGKCVVGTRVVRADDGAPAGFFRAFLVRLAVPFAIGFLGALGGLFTIVDVVTILFTQDRRCLHDYMAGTVVVDA